MNNKILVIEDTRLIRFQIKNWLQDSGYTNVVEYNSADQIIKNPQIHLEDACLIILDIGLPDVNGIELAEKISKMPEYINIPIVFISGRNDTTTVKDAIKAGAVDYFVKPIRHEDFINRVNKILGKHLVIKNRDEKMKKIDDIIMNEYQRASRGDSQLGFLLYQANSDLLDKSQVIVSKHLRQIDSVLLLDKKILIILPLTAEENLSVVINKINNISQEKELDLELKKSFSYLPSSDMKLDELKKEIYG